MASTKLLYLVTFCLIGLSSQNLDDNEIDIENNPYKEAAQDIRKEQNAQNIGAMFKNVLENEGENLMKNIMSELGKNNAGNLLQGLGSLLSNQGENKKKGEPNILESLGNLMSNFQGNDGGQGQGTAALLKGLGSLLSQGGGRNQGQDNLLQGLGSLLGGGQNGEGGIDPALLASMLNVFNSHEKEKEAPEVRKSVNPKGNRKEIDEEFNMNDLLTLAGSLLNTGEQKGKKQDGSFLSLLPPILQTINTFIGPEADERAKSHEGHSWLMPPLLEKMHILFDHFIHSEMGKQTIAALGAEKSFKVFLDEKGRFSYKKFGELMENHSYRRQWIRIVTDRIAKLLQYVSEPKIYKAYFATGQVFFNTYFKSQGFPKASLFDPARPVETISAFVNHVAKKYFDVRINSKEYVKPAVLYIQDVLKLSEKSGTLKSFSDSNQLSNKLADTINLEIIEPLARVNRAFRFAKSVPKCERYVLCLVNEETQNDAESLPGLKRLLSKGSSFVAGWFLSAQTGTPFWTLYTDITKKTDCQKLYFDECNDFHVEELKVTTEYVHNEL